MANTTPKLKADLDNGEGHLIVMPGWHDLPPLLRADILGDWRVQIEAEYWQARADMRKEAAAAWLRGRKRRKEAQS
jgi:hypothetical protein